MESGIYFLFLLVIFIIGTVVKIIYEKFFSFTYDLDLERNSKLHFLQTLLVSLRRWWRRAHGDEMSDLGFLQELLSSH